MAAGSVIAIALRLAAAQFLDPDCADGDDHAEFQFRSEAFGILHGEAKKATSAQSGPKAKQKLVRAMAELHQMGFNPHAESAHQSLEAFLLDLESHNVHAEPIAAIAAKIADHVWSELAGTCAHAGLSQPPLRFSTSLNKTINARAVSGETSISGLERSVWLLLTDETLRSDRFVEIIYTLFHEIVCHAFQAVDSSCPEDVGADCAWTEGWMDTVARDMACEWVSSSQSGSPLSPESARMTIMSAHESRYRRFSDPAIGMARRQAREACVKFPGLLLKFNFEKTTAASKSTARAFSFALNSHPLTTKKRLKIIGDNLRRAIGREEVPTVQSEAVAACVDFVQKRNLIGFLGRLERLEL